ETPLWRFLGCGHAQLAPRALQSGVSLRFPPQSKGGPALRLKLQRVDVGVFQDEAEADGLAGERGEVAAGFPGDGAVEVVPRDGGAVIGGVAGDRLARGILELDRDRAGDAGGEIELEFAAGEGDRLG